MTLGKALARLTYKPGWRFRIEGRRLIVAFDTLDSTRKRRVGIVGVVIREIPRHLITQVRRGRAAGFYDYVGDLIREREEHEVREWLKVNGHCLTDPHPRLCS